MKNRNLAQRVRAGLADTPVVYLQGARQTGKSTLARAIAATVPTMRYATLDDPSERKSAFADPLAYVSAEAHTLVLDEVQHCPELFPAIKLLVDRDRRPGRFLLTGSANTLVVPEMARALVGRVDIATLRGLSQAEIAGSRERFVDWLYSDEAVPSRLPASGDLGTRVTIGGYPEVLARDSAERRSAWFDAYLETMLQRDVRDLANVAGLHELPDLLRLCAARVGSLLNLSELSRASGLPHTTLKRYVALLESVCLIHRLPAWNSNLGKRVVRSPKLCFLDSGIAAHLQGIDSAAWKAPATRRGPLLENFVFGEVERALGWARTRADLYHYRSHAGAEIDLVLEDRRGRVAGIEVKAKASLSSADLAPLRDFSQELGSRFVRGVVLYDGTECTTFGERLHALPISALWSIVE